ncbi:hypothetical protein GYMLUDRAFT_937969 [Collybiopsis luxurians FD-317 M1]|uniref:Uncharacterized protein n=1 Tax=Collybiopsis luxurians FD-317 M1 TaxID=944289 RepID=A0A0D0ASD6_9AGAR|nr:hypothetical protein GYMLUDRAFT_937969 [Collybiopsis luxurians FD-317 M1]
MESRSTIITTATVDFESTDESTSMDKIFQRALLEYEAQKQNRGLRFPLLEPQAAQQLVDHLQSILDSRQHGLNDHTKYFSIFRYLSRRFQTLPSSLIIRDIKREGPNPIAGGGFAVSAMLSTWRHKFCANGQHIGRISWDLERKACRSKSPSAFPRAECKGS